MPKTPTKSPIRFESRVRKFSVEASMHYLEVPPAVLERLGGKYMVRVICEMPSAKLKFHCAIMPVGNGKACIFFSQEKLRTSGLKVGQSVKIQVKLDTSRYGMKLPAELAEALKQDAEARRRFNALSPGKQRNIIFHVSSTKDEEKRIGRAVQVLRDLVIMPEGKEVMAVLLNPTLKENFSFTTPAEEAEFQRRFVPSQATKSKGRTASTARTRKSP